MRYFATIGLAAFIFVIFACIALVFGVSWIIELVVCRFTGFDIALHSARLIGLG